VSNIFFWWVPIETDEAHTVTAAAQMTIVIDFVTD
jgi:hypothetical protein